MADWHSTVGDEIEAARFQLEALQHDWGDNLRRTDEEIRWSLLSGLRQLESEVVQLKFTLSYTVAEFEEGDEDE